MSKQIHTVNLKKQGAKLLSYQGLLKYNNIITINALA